MYPKEKISEFKENLKSSIQTWSENKIDTLCQDKPAFKAASVYLKRGFDNWMDREEGRIDGFVDNALLFITDKEGNIDSDMLIDDAITMFKQMDVVDYKFGAFPIHIGKGEISVDIPHNFFFDMIFGDIGKIRLTSEDLIELKELLK